MGGPPRKPRATRPPEDRPLWRCPRCGKRFVTRNVYHSCARVPLDHHFRGRPLAKAIFRRLDALLRSFGPVRIVSNKTRVGWRVRVRFARVDPLKDGGWLDVWLPRPLLHPRVAKVREVAPRCYLHSIRLRGPEEVDAEVRGILGGAYAVGCQAHLRDRSGGPGSVAAPQTAG
ncbi:MAG: DUF5655 domain-containing protein [Planctomycetota bacterium]